MDPDELREAVVDWVEDDLLSAEQGISILGRYDIDPPESLHSAAVDSGQLADADVTTEDARGESIDDDLETPEAQVETDHADLSMETSRSGIVTAIALMGGLLVSAGIGLYLATAWDSIPDIVRAIILLAVPIAGFISGLQLVARNRPRVGHGIWFASAAFVGATLFLSADLYMPDIDRLWLFAGWTIVALAAGHGYPSRPTTVLGLLLSGVFIVDVGDNMGVDPVIPIGALGVFLFVVGASRIDPAVHELGRGRPDFLGGTYRLVGVAYVLFGMIATAAGSSIGSFPETGGSLCALLLFVAAISAGLFGIRIFREEAALSSPRGTSGLWAAGAFLALSLSVLLIRFGDPVPELALFLLTHGVSLAVLTGGVVLGYVVESRGIVNVIALAFLVQLLIFLEAAIGSVLPQSLALVIAGIVLLAAAFGLERGRRELFARMKR